MDPRDPKAPPDDDADILVSGLIHEMRHPLLGIKAGLQMLAMQSGAALTSREEWQMITAQIARAEELFRTYEDLFGRQRGSGETFELGEVVRRAVELLRYRLSASNARFSFEPGVARVAARGAPQAVLHAVTNLIANALDAVERAGDGLRIEVRVLEERAGSPFVEVRVSDEGVGVKPEDQQRIFAPRFTTKSAGMGLGLHLARKALGSCGGEVALVGNHDAGRAPWARTEFAVRVPAAGVAP